MTLTNLGIQLNQLQLNKTFINIDFNNSPVDFWRFANFSRHNKVPSHIIFEQALEKGLIEDSKKNLLERFIKLSALLKESLIKNIIKQFLYSTVTDFAKFLGLSMS